VTPQQEQQLLQSLYDRLFDAITYVPDGKAGAFDKQTTLIQFSKNEALNPADFKNAASPVNPQGDFKTAYAFSAMVDDIPNVDAVFSASGKKLAGKGNGAYPTIVNGANTDNVIDPAQKAIYDKARQFLTQTTKMKKWDGSTTEQLGPTPIAQAYNDNRTAYNTAVSGFRVAQNGFNMDDPKDQRAWLATAPVLQDLVDKAFDKWAREGKQDVEDAQNAMATSINDAIAAVIAQSQDRLKPAHWLPSLVQGGDQWLLSYAMPGDWAAGSEGATGFSLRSDYLNTSTDSSFTSMGGGASWGVGLWSVGGSFQSTEGQTNYHMDANSVQISAKLKIVRIMRPWLNTLLFSLNGWWVKGFPVNGISNGTLKAAANLALPLIPTALVVASDVTIKADFSTIDKSHIEKAVSGSARVGWGPFSVGGNYSHSESHDKMTATFDGAAIRIPGFQILAWISTITPPAPPLAGH
jgi:hypothetical protein